MNPIRVTDINEIGSILDLVHDRFFDLDKLSFEQFEREFVIPLTVITEGRTKERKTVFGYRWINEIVDAELVFRNAIGYSIQDDAQIGEADINTISQEHDFIVIRCGVPVTIRIAVTSIDIECCLSDRIVGEIKRFSFRKPPKNLSSD